MEHYEMVEKLRQKANVSYEEARAALEQCEWDILDALVLLENEGKVKEDRNASQNTAQKKEKSRTVMHVEMEDGAWKEGLKKFWKFVCRLFQKGNANSFLIRNKRGEEAASMPITVLVLLLILCWPLSLVILVLGLFMNYRYSFQGPDISTKVNDAMNKAADAVQNDHKEQE